MIIYYDTKTGNVQRFVQKVQEERPEWKFLSVTGCYVGPGHLITYTAGAGQVPMPTLNFLAGYADQICSVSVSGNRNWGASFAAAAYIINREFRIPIAHLFELSGLDDDVRDFITKISEFEVYP